MPATTATAARRAPRSRFLLPLLAALPLLLGVLLVPSGAAEAAPRPKKVRPVEPSPTVEPTPAPDPAPSTGAAGDRRFSVFLPGAPGDPAALATLAEQAGAAPEMVMWFEAWATTPAFPAAAAARVAATGAVPQITWEPWDPAAGTVQPAYAAAAVAGGSQDAYLRTWAQQVRAYGGPVELRVAHESNGDWYPWAAGVNGNTAADTVAAFRHVHDVFAAEGADNVAWVWSPNISYPGSTPLASLYPGDAYVDLVALDGYNFGTTQSWSTWQTPGQLFTASLAELTALTARPVHLGEVGSTEVGGDKAAWVTDFFALLAAEPAIRGFCWFDVAKETDWRIASSPAAQQAFAVGLASLR